MDLREEFLRVQVEGYLFPFTAWEAKLLAYATSWLFLAESDYWYHSCMQKWSLKCCWNKAAISTVSIAFTKTTIVPRQPQVVQGFEGGLISTTGKVWPLKIASYFVWVQGAGSWVPENQSIENCLKLVKLSCLCLLSDFLPCVTTRHHQEQKRLKLSIWTTHFLFEFYVDLTIPPMLLLKFSYLCNLFSK